MWAASQFAVASLSLDTYENNGMQYATEDLMLIQNHGIMIQCNVSWTIADEDQANRKGKQAVYRF